MAPSALAPGGARGFASNTLSCPTFQGTTAMLVETDCVWLRATGRRALQNTAGASDIALASMTWQIGGQKEIGSGWLLGGSLAYEDSSLSSADKVTSGRGQMGYGAVTLKYQTGAWLFASSAFGGAGQFSTGRVINLPGLGGVAKGSPDTSNVGVLLRASYTIGHEGFYLRPNLSLTAMRVGAGAYRKPAARGWVWPSTPRRGPWSC